MINYDEDKTELPFNDSIDYSEEFIELYKKQPRWIIRWGIVVISLSFLLFFVLSFFISYPDLISAQITITTNVPPQKLVAKTSGKIEAVFVKNKSEIRRNTAIAVIENSASYKDIFLLKNILDTIDIEKNKFPFKLFASAQLGDIENAYNSFEREFVANELNSQLKPFRTKSMAYNKETNEVRQRISILESQREINSSELVFQKNDLDRYETLFAKGIISSQEIEKQRIIYLQAQKNYKNILNTISQLKSSLNQTDFSSKENSINEEKEYVNLERNLYQAIYQLKNAVKQWELNYVLRSSIDGKLSYSQVWAKNQNVSLGDNVFTVIPKDENGLIGKAKAIALNSGKIRVGQRVNINLDNYPEREFGYVKGVVKSISLTPDKDGLLLIDISLIEGLNTSYKKKISFQQEMIGHAEIVTEDLKLIERLLYQFKDIFKR